MPKEQASGEPLPAEVSDDPRHQTLRDVREALDRSTEKMNVRDLERKGFRQVKVIKQSEIRALVLAAVDKVLALRGEIDTADPEAVRAVEEELAALMQERQERETEIDTLRAQVGSLEAEVKALRGALHTEELKGSRLQEIADLSEQAVAEGERLQLELEAVVRERDLLQGEVQGLAMASAAGQVQRSDPRVDRLEELIARLYAGREVERISGQAMDPKVLEDTMAKVAERISERLSRRIGADVPVEVGEAALEAIVRDIDRVKIESNVSQVTVKEHKAEGVKSALDRLRALKGDVPKGEA